ncbi:hypothetical protein F4780DRAFT_458097 [Xylariomycetidae sp. FL0641]|nr:hypothetical protein F4780DRAFT_458097 [Xylariomycetidae sp. FL0641]
MPISRRRIRTSRRIPPLKDAEIDHEIDLVDHDDAVAVAEEEAANPDANPPARPLSAATTNNTTADTSMSASGQPLIASDSHAPLTQNSQEIARSPPPPTAKTNKCEPHEPDAQPPTSSTSTTRRASRRISLLAGGPRPQPPKEPETAIDILYENQRGGFLCGAALFSSAALGNLDPPAWTTGAHAPSPTDIRTAQVPDPSWEWAWPEWRVNHDGAVEADADGWEYSFMFARRFSWHGPTWYSSCVRRRAWIRRRVRRGTGYLAHDDEHMLNGAYFTVGGGSRKQRQQKRLTMTTVDWIEAVGEAEDDDDDNAGKEENEGGTETEEDDAPPIPTADALLRVLRRARIDREKLDAVENYIAHSRDQLARLDQHMHEIMAVFVFQASRKLLLARLVRLHDEVSRAADNPAPLAKRREAEQKDNKGKQPAAAAAAAAAAPDVTPPPTADDEARKRAAHLAAAIRHADEEVRRLEYWSDIKGMAEAGASRGAVAGARGWDPAGWEGLDCSGAAGVRVQGQEKLPGL